MSMTNAEDEKAIQEAIDSMDKKQIYGTDDPDDDTPGNIYFKKGATTTDPLTVFIKDRATNVWWGGV